MLAGLSFPTFVVGLLLLYLLFFRLTLLGIEWFPAGGYVPLTEDPWEWARHLILPWFTVAFATAATYARLTRGQMLEVFGEDYIRTARAKGCRSGGWCTGTDCAARSPRCSPSSASTWRWCSADSWSPSRSSACRASGASPSSR